MVHNVPKGATIQGTVKASWMQLQFESDKIDYELLCKIHNEHPRLFEPAFRLQQLMMINTLGEVWWTLKKRGLQDKKEIEISKIEKIKAKKEKRKQKKKNRKIQRNMGLLKYYCCPCFRKYYDPSLSEYDKLSEEEKKERDRQLAIQRRENELKIKNPETAYWLKYQKKVEEELKELTEIPEGEEDEEGGEGEEQEKNDEKNKGDANKGDANKGDEGEKKSKDNQNKQEKKDLKTIVEPSNKASTSQALTILPSSKPSSKPSNKSSHNELVLFDTSKTKEITSISTNSPVMKPAIGSTKDNFFVTSIPREKPPETGILTKARYNNIRAREDRAMNRADRKKERSDALKKKW